MDPRLTARLERLRVLSEPDLAALPKRSPTLKPAQTMALCDPPQDGGIRLDAPPSSAACEQESECLTLPSSMERTVQTASPSDSIDATASLSTEQDAPPVVDKHMTASSPGHVVSSNGQDANVDQERRFVWVQGTESSHNLGTHTNLSALPANLSKLPPTDLQRSQLAPACEKYFTPIVALSKYPYKFCDKDWKQTIASAFFDEGKFWAREWDLYYLWDIEELKPLILVSQSQVETLLTEINSRFELKLKATDSRHEEGLVVRVPDHPRCRPRYLGRSQAKSEYESMANNTPGVLARPVDEMDPLPLDATLMEDFKIMIADAWEMTKNKSKALKEKKRVDRMQKLKSMTDQLKRAQRYLGLRPTASKGQIGAPAPPAVDTSLPVPFTFDRSVVFVCVDVEAYEKDHKKITEVGIATLDTQHLENVAPGRDGENWRALIRARHFRIRDYAHLVNNEYVSGCPGSFFFGQSELVSLKDAPAFVASCFQPPFCAAPDTSHNHDDTSSSGMRNLVFLGHDTITDIKYLQDLGFDALTLPNLLEAQDSANIYRVWRRDDQISKLGRILEQFDIDHFGLHNAGNDAVYTVQSFLAVLVRESSIRCSPGVQEAWLDKKDSKIAFEQEELKKDVENDSEAWDSIAAAGDGGDPVPVVLKRSAASAILPQASTKSVPMFSNFKSGGFESEKGQQKIARATNGGEHGNVHTQYLQGNNGDPNAPQAEIKNDDGWGGFAEW